MKILAVSDEISPAFWDYYAPGRFDGIDLIISCGDLKASYLSFLATMSGKRVLYVCGNHDEAYLSEPPEGCDCIDGHLVTYNGIRILGLGGCHRYHPGPFQYTERQMAWRLARLKFALLRNKGVDIVVTHAPPRGLGDLEDPAHQGFQTFVKLIDQYHPGYLLHGHVHLRYMPMLPREHAVDSTRIINVSERFVFEIPDKATSIQNKDRLIYKTRHKDPGEAWDSFHL